MPSLRVRRIVADPPKPPCAVRKDAQKTCLKSARNAVMRATPFASWDGGHGPEGSFSIAAVPCVIRSGSGRLPASALDTDSACRDPRLRGINLEYFFSYTDPTGYGCGTKLPHNITSLVGVMDGAASDLRPGLPWQMVEIHEPVRLLMIVEATPQAMLDVLEQSIAMKRLVSNNWIQLAVVDPDSARIHIFRNGQFQRLPTRIRRQIPVVKTSVDWCRGWRDHLGFASVVGGMPSLVCQSPRDTR